MDGKKTEAVTVKLSEEMHRFVEIRSQQKHFESPGEYIPETRKTNDTV
jgi:hypothetical protein